jgi:cysteinyl-tRNA synthetase
MPLNYSGEILMQAKSGLERIKTARENMVFISENGADGGMTEEEAVDAISA